LVTIRLDRNPMPAGEPTWITTSVENTGQDAVSWFHDGCANPVGVWGQVEARWREGLQMIGDPAQFKRYALGLSLDLEGPAPIYIQFVPEDRVGRGSVGCADIGITDEIAPGEVLERRQQWNGQAAGALGLAPAGPVRLDALFGYYWRASEAQPDEIIDRTIEVSLDAWVDPGKPEVHLDPPEVIDIALTDPQFAAWFAERDFANGVQDWVRFLPDANAWEVGVIEWNTPGGSRLHYVIIDPIDGTITDRVDRAWDQRADPMP
jgi:hypothetical protein